MCWRWEAVQGALSRYADGNDISGAQTRTAEVSTDPPVGEVKLPISLLWVVLYNDDHLVSLYELCLFPFAGGYSVRL